MFYWFELVCFANKNKDCPLPYSWFQTSQTGGKWYSDTFPFSIPCLIYEYEESLHSKLLVDNFGQSSFSLMMPGRLI